MVNSVDVVTAAAGPDEAAVERWWRIGAAALLLYLSIEGLVQLVFYPSIAPLFAKDVIVVFVYAAFGLWFRMTRPSLRRLWPLAPFALFAVLCVAECFNPAARSWLLALVGLKTRLLYVPLVLVGYFWLRTARDVESIALIAVLPSIPVNVFGLVQYLLGANRVAAWSSGFAASIWTIGQFNGSPVYRPASTFSSTGHYASYLVFVTLVTAALATAPSLSRRARRGVMAALILQFAAIPINGSRALMLFVPAGCGAIWLVSLVRARQVGAWGPIAVAVRRAVMAAVLALAVGVAIAPSGVYRATSIVAPSTPRQLNLSDTLQVTWARVLALPPRLLWTGQGLGSASPGRRYLDGGLVREGRVEGMLGELVWEMGVPGAVFFATGWLLVLGMSLWRVLHVRDIFLFSFGSALLVYGALTLIASATYAQIAYSPTSVLFWLFLAMPLGLPSLEC